MEIAAAIFVGLVLFAAFGARAASAARVAGSGLGAVARFLAKFAIPAGAIVGATLGTLGGEGTTGPTMLVGGIIGGIVGAVAALVLWFVGSALRDAAPRDEQPSTMRQEVRLARRKPKTRLSSQSPPASPSGGDGTRCPNCRTDNRPGAKFCRKCARNLSATCDACGAKNVVDAAFCDDCGARVAQPAVAAPVLQVAPAPTRSARVPTREETLAELEEQIERDDAKAPLVRPRTCPTCDTLNRGDAYNCVKCRDVIGPARR
jgi:hypothetical protein